MEEDTSAISIHSRGGMDLIMTTVDPDTIHLVGRQQRSTMICYLHNTENSSGPAWPAPCYNTRTTRSYLPHTPVSRTKRPIQSCSHLFTRVLWGPGTGSVCPRQLKHLLLISLQPPLTSVGRLPTVHQFEWIPTTISCIFTQESLQTCGTGAHANAHMSVSHFCLSTNAQFFF